MTKKGSPSLRSSPPAVTCFSCMASSMADWVLGVARLISSARIKCAKIGPRWNSKARLPASVSMTRFVPRMSAGMRSGAPDLMPADILGTNLVMDTDAGKRAFEFQRGPIFAHLILADEINRATPKTQSAMLEAMQEKQVTAGGELRKLGEPFFVMATQNPIDQEGTYPLPEAQLDRFFFKIIVGYPNADELTEVINRTTTGSRIEVGKVLDRDNLSELMKLVREVPVASHEIGRASCRERV